MKKVFLKTTRFDTSYKQHLATDPSIKARLKKFRECKNNGWPLPSNFFDHVLDPPFNGQARECHLGPDSLLIYRESSTKISMEMIVSHSDIVRGSKSESDVAKRVNDADPL